MGTVKFHTELRVYQKSFEMAMKIYRLSFSFPKDEKFSLTDQIRRSSRSVCTNISEAWGKRKYEKSFVAKLTDSDGESRETQTWLEFAIACDYITKEDFECYNEEYHKIIGMLVNMSNNAASWSSFKPYENE